MQASKNAANLISSKELSIMSQRQAQKAKMPKIVGSLTVRKEPGCTRSFNLSGAPLMWLMWLFIKQQLEEVITSTES